MGNDLTWVEISKSAATHNLTEFRKLVTMDTILCPCVKGNAYGHGLVEMAKILGEAGADWLGVNALYEARALRDADISHPIYLLGYVSQENLAEAISLDCRIVVYNIETIDAIGTLNKPVTVHIKVETGNNRQGILPEELEAFISRVQQYPHIRIEGIATHFANIEDTTDHAFAEKQLVLFEQAVQMLQEKGIDIPLKHCANTAATILFKKTHFNMVRPGIGVYGLWPSTETYVSYLKEIGNGFSLKPVLSWKTRIAQIKMIKAGEYIGYGCTYRTGHDMKLAILPVGYYDGYDRGAGAGHVLIRGKRAPIRGRICMNIMMVEVTDIPEARLEDDVVLIGNSGDEEITVEQYATWAGTINYEAVTRINERIPRVIVS